MIINLRVLLFIIFFDYADNVNIVISAKNEVKVLIDATASIDWIATNQIY